MDLKFILTLALPAIKALIESTVVPILKRKTYEHFDDYATVLIEKLAILKEKAYNETDGIKKEAHLEGLKLGAFALKAIADKLNKGADLFLIEN